MVSYYNKGGYNNKTQNVSLNQPLNKTQSPLIRPLNLTTTESADLVAFLKTLTGSNVETLVSDAFSTTIGDTH